MKFPVLDNNFSDEMFYEWLMGLPPPEYVNFTGYRVDSKHKTVQWTKTYQRQYNASGYYYTFLREQIGKKYAI